MTRDRSDEGKKAREAFRGRVVRFAHALPARDAGARFPCRSRAVSRPRWSARRMQFFKLCREGHGPRLMSVGSVGKRVSREAGPRWIAAREQEAKAASRGTAPTENETGDPESRPNDADCNDPLRAGPKVPDECDMARIAP
jgi:hypothetical protein